MNDVYNDQRWCDGCEWGVFLGDRTYCPFVVGSCARFPGTIEEPDNLKAFLAGTAAESVFSEKNMLKAKVKRRVMNALKAAGNAENGSERPRNAGD